MMASCNEVKETEIVSYHIVPPPKAKSRCWKYFGFKASPSGEILDKKRMICRLCKSEFSYSGNTTNLSQHLTRKHPHLQNDILRTTNTSYIFLDELRDLPTQDVITVHSNAEAEGDTNFLIVKYIVKSMLPLRTVESPPFVNFVQALRPDVNIPSTASLKMSIVPTLYEKIKEELRNIIQSVPKCSLSCYEWSGAKYRYLTMTTHFINEQCHLQNRILKTYTLTDTNTGAQFIDIFQNLLSEWTFSKEQISAIVTSNIDDNDMLRVTEFLELNTLPCIDHVLQAVSDVILKSEKIVSIISRLEEIIGTIELNKSVYDSLQSQLSALNSNWKIQNFKLDRRYWYFTYNVLNLILLHKDLLEQNVNPVLFSVEEWTILSEAVAELKPFHVVVSSLCQADYVSLSLVKPIVSQLINKRCLVSTNDSVFVQGVRKQTKFILERFFMNKDFDSVLNIAAFVDPRFKVLGFMNIKEKESLLANVQVEMLKYAVSEDKDKTPSPKRIKKECDNDISFLLAEVCENDVSCVSSLEERATQEIAAYRVEEPPSFDCNPIEWWRINWHRYPLLFNVAKVYLSIPATCQKTVCLFSKDADLDILESNRCRIEPKFVDIMMFLNCGLAD